SGSTGQPKGVMVEHRSLANLVAWHRAAFGVQAGDRSSSVAGFGFDATTWEVWPPLCSGAALLLPSTRDPQALLEWWEAQALDVSFLPTPLAEVAFARGRASAGLRTLLIGGDRLRSMPAEPLPYTLVNNYGPTETTVVATSGEIGASAKVHIGRPIANMRVYVLDRAGHPVPEGVAGELYIGGAGVARGYQHRPGLTAERFVPDPFASEPGARLYRTGDLARWLADGTLEFVGRTDFQVKIRGFRIELSEAEARLSEHPAVRDAVVLARQDVSADPRLVAYYVGEALDVETLRAHLSERLPEYMVPAAYVRLATLPLTPNGKVDRKALPAPEGDAFDARAYEAPVGETEQALAEIWAELLGAERVGRGDDFFALGGHSLLAVQVISRVRQTLGVEVSSRDVFERPLLADFARGLQTAARAESAAIERVDRTGNVPLSFAQQRLWFLEQLGGTGAAYHIPMRLRLQGALDRGALVRALDRIVARHEVLRTTFPTVDGEPVQRIAPAEESGFRLLEHDLRAAPDAEDALRRLVRDEASAPFDLAHGPLIRGRLVRMGADDHVLLLTMHHIVSDGWSAGVLHRELGALYAAFAAGETDPLPPLPVQYADYAAWHRRWVEGDVLRRQADYWRQTLAGAPELLELPTDHARPTRQDFAGASLPIELDEALTAALKTLGQRHGATLHMTLLAGWAAVLARLSGQDQVVVGTPSANRGHAEVEGLIGFFVNTLALRVDLSGSPSVAELLGRVKERSLGAQQHQDIPFEQVVELVQPVRSLAHTPLFQVMFAWQNAPGGALQLPGLTVGAAGVGDADAAPFDLSLELWEDDGRIAGALNYATALFDPATVERHAGYLRRVLQEMAADDTRPVDRLELLSAAERARVVVEWNRTAAEYPRGSCIHTLFEAQAARTPDAVAVEYEDRALSYAELNARANRLAHHLRALGVGPDARVALCVERGVEMIVAMLAALKAGGAYVPLDPSYPDERLRYMLADSRPAVLLAPQSQAERFAAAGVPVLDPADGAEWAHHPDTDPRPGGLSPDHLCYVIYTSGSTGRPKGVAVPHRGVASLLADMQRRAPIGEGDGCSLWTSTSFDVSVYEIFSALLAGGRLCIPRDDVRLEAGAFLDWMEARDVHSAYLPPYFLAELRDRVARSPGRSRLHRLLVGVEPIPEPLLAEIRRSVPGLRIINGYGPTETTICATLHDVPDTARGERLTPIGPPAANTRVFVVDARMRPVPVGVVGELYVGGVGVARGYLNRPALTAERFVPDPLSGEPGARLYRTGDLGRWLPEGALAFAGRTDAQVKVRGYRVEPGEIEARLAEHPAVREAVVVAREDAPGETRLVAYVVGDEAGADVLRAHLAERLPEHMVPAAYVRLETLPLTPSGKVDRRALPAPEGDAYVTRGYEAPSSDAETPVAGIWAEVLGVERVGRRDHFFELGGHSLVAVRVISRVREALGVEAQAGDLFERPVLADFARGLQTAARAEATAIAPVERSGPLPLSFAQQRLWFLEQLGNLGSTYHIPSGLRLRGELDRGALVRALDRIVARHEALRTTFHAVDGEPVQHIAPVEESGFRLVEHDLRASPDAEGELRRIVQDEANAPFDLARGPLVRGRLVRMAADDHVLLLTMHHIVSDAWSAGVLHRELGALYTAFARGEGDPLPPLPVQYADYAAWHRRFVEGEVLEAQADYWRQTLAGAPELLELPADHPRPARQDFAGASVNVVFDEALTAALKTLSQRHGATLFMTLLAGWATVLARLSGQDDVVVGTPSANRGHAEVEELIGFFVNMLPLRVDLSDGPGVGELLQRVKARAMEAQRNQDIPFEQVVDLVHPARSLAHTPLFQVMFAWQNAARESLQLPGLALGPLDAVGYASSRVSAKFDLSLDLWEEDGRIEGVVEYATALFERETVERWLGYLRRVLEGMVADEQGRVERLELLSAAERRQVVEEWNATDAAYPADRCIHELFAARAARTPDATAIVWRDETLSYATLDHAANRLAKHLRRRGVRPETRVGICLERGPELVVAILAVLKAGGAYVPLDPAYPAERLAFMLADSGAPLLLTRLPLPDGLTADGVEVVCLDADRERIAAESTEAPAAGVLPENLAYVIYTSGSTGRPKGVLVPHRGVPNLAYAQARRFGIDNASRVLQFASFSFDAAVAELFDALLTGATLVMAPREALLPGPGLLETLRRGRVTVATLPPSVLAILPPDDLPELRTVASAGEAVDAATVERWSAERTFVNAYGPTEVTVCATSARCEPDGRAPTIGRPLENVRVYVLDAAGAPAPVGVPGELYVGGVGVARGYMGRPGLTAERFVPDPFSGETGARLYRTGDRARWSARGELEFLGRVDEQVKVRGFRIEPGEIEARLLEHAGVREAVVVAREDAPGESRLVAYVAGDEKAGADVLRAHLSERLPEYMVPAAYVRLDTLPLTPNGKIDRKALPAPEGDAFASRGYEAPSGQVEEAVAAIWSELLGAERVGRHDHFFELGGHSLLAVRVVSRVRQALGVEALPGDVFERPVLADFARGLQTTARAEAAAIERVDRTGTIPLSFAQQRLWFLEQIGGTGAAYHIPVSLRLRGELDRGALVRALDRIVARHEVLRTVFATVDGEPVQRIAPAEEGAFRLVEHDLRAAPDADDELRRIVRDEASAPFDLAQGPLIRGRLVRMAADDHVLLLTMHHIVSDGWSTGLLHRELGALYAAFVRGDADPLPPLPVQYADYAVWHRRRVDGPVLEAQAEYWTRTLAGAPELLALPADHPRPARQDFAGGLVKVELDEGLATALRTLSQRHGTTLFMTLLAGWAAVLARLSGQEDVVIGTPSANRGQAEVEELIGFFVNTLAVRIDLSDGPDVGELLDRVKTRALEAQRNQDIPFEQVVERVRPVRSLAHSPLFQVMFSWEEATDGELALPGLTVGDAGVAGTDTTKFDLLLSLGERDGRIAGWLTYARSLFERETAERYAGYFRRVLEAMAADRGGRMDRVALLAAAEHDQVVHAWNRTAADVPRGACLPDLFEAQAARTPDADAVVYGDQSLSFAALNARANRLAHHLRALGVRPDARVGLCLERSVDAIVGLLAALKAGGAYVPLDPSYPVERLRDMLADSAPVVLLTQASLRERVGALGVPMLALDADAGAWAELSAENPARPGLTPEHLAYVIYTSGSTGRPKGVMVRHGSVVNLAAALQARIYAEHPSPLRVGVNAPLVFDGSVKQVIQLLSGHALCLVPDAVRRDPAALVAWLRTERVDALDMTPSLLRLALGAGLGRDGVPRFVLVGGEAVDDELRERMSRVPTRFYNVYGPTECTVDVTAREIGAAGPAAAIGGPLPNVATYVLDPGLLPVPAGVAGELYVGGAGVARGYLNRPATTAERFVPDPFGGEPGARLYRTGDRVRWRQDSAEVSSPLDSRTDALTHSRTAYLEYLGRLDVQVKVRGFRIELGEIEARLAEHPQVRQAVVLAREDALGETRLVAYVVGGAPDAQALRAHLAQRLPEYMVPAAYVRLDAFPVTTNGKVDRKALPAPEGDAFAARAYEAPVGPAEQAVAAIWAELLGAERIGRHDHFFESGGHSLLAVRVASRIRQALGVEAAPADLFERPVLADFARVLETAARAEGAAIQRVDRIGTIPLSFAQQRLWFLEQLGSLGSTYHIPMGMRLRGGLDGDALRRALDRIVARHEALRTTFPAVDGEPVQRIAPAEGSALRLVEHDLHAAPDAEDRLVRIMSEEAAAPFDLAQGPLIRGRLVRMAADDHVLLLTMHHIVSDGWSAGVLFRELASLYAAFARGETDPLPPLPVQYADYAVWHRRWVEGPFLEAQAEYWTRTLAGAPELLELPTDHPRPARQDFAGAWVDVELDAPLAAALKTLSQRHGTTLFMTLLAGWAAVLARLADQDDVVIGTASANRGHAEVEELIGFFVNTLPLRVDLSDGPTVGELLLRVKSGALEAQRNQDIPFEQVVERVRPTRSLAHAPLFQVMFGWQDAPDGTLELPGLRSAAVPVSAPETAKFDLTLTLAESGDRIVGGLNYASALFDRATVERWAGYLRRVLEGMAADESRPVGRLEIVPEAERARVLDAWSRTEAVQPGASRVHALFEAQVQRAPGAAAVVFGHDRMSYAELNTAANRLARRLRTAGVGPDARVGVMLERSAELVVALLAVLKAGGAYLPLDVSLPAARRAALAADAGAAVLVTREPALEGFGGTLVSPAEAEGEDGDDLGLEVPAAALAYVIYTSGSTGTPKGVGVAHAEAAAHCRAAVSAYGLTPADRVLQFAAVGFDVSLEQMLAPLSVGACVVMRGSEVPTPLELARQAAEQGMTVINPPTAYWHQLAADADALEILARTVRLVIAGGEAMSPAAARGWASGPASGVRLLNGYGPTEAVVTCAAYDVPPTLPEGAVHVPVGRPLAGRAAYVVDGWMHPAPLGAPGELCIGGVLARGYLGRPAATAAAFVPDPFSATPGARMYRTGDRARWLEERADVGSGFDSSRTHALPHSRTRVLEFLGRRDHQVKVRGFRIELGEIEARLAGHPEVRESVVLAREDAPGDRRLVAYVVGGEGASAEALRAHLAETLPSYMVPTAFVRLDAFPLTPNGKLDRAALPAPEGDAGAREYEAPVGKVETSLAEIWAELLGVERVGRGDDFFMLGGHSLLAVQMISRVRQAMEVELALVAVFETPVLSALADRILDLRLARFDPETLARLAALVREPGAPTP
ncbi:non-ribosomal peptide synthase/polyketide synthase, partial [Longimicrobium sp.]|uniref:non-ribosomal peptide synthase/polyketide synthase n=1 Tax=Longimicrobium sp. TaxID=2029185 RepID=UPI003B3B6E4D